MNTNWWIITPSEFEFWTPHLRTVNDTTEPSYRSQQGYLYRTENLVFAYCFLECGGSLLQGSGNLMITGCPYLPDSPDGMLINIPVVWGLVRGLNPGFIFAGWAGWNHPGLAGIGWRLAAITATGGTQAIPVTAVNSETVIFGSCVFPVG